MVLLRYQVFVALVLIASAQKDVDEKEDGINSVSSSVSVNSSGGESNFQARAFLGNSKEGKELDSSKEAQAKLFPFFSPINDYQNAFTYANFLQQYISQMQQYIQAQIQAQNQAAAAAFGGTFGFGTPAATSNSANGVQGATAGGHFGPFGGYGSASLSSGSQPVTVTHFQGGDIPPPSPGSNYQGSFSSVSSSSSNINGQQQSQHSATFGVNDNGNLTVYHVHNP